MACCSTSAPHDPGSSPVDASGGGSPESIELGGVASSGIGAADESASLGSVAPSEATPEPPSEAASAGASEAASVEAPSVEAPSAAPSDPVCAPMGWPPHVVTA